MWPDYRLTPRYRQELPLEGVLKAVRPGSDAYPSEKYAAEIEDVLADWSVALRQSPADFRTLGKYLTASFKGSAFQPTDDHSMRSGSGLQVSRLQFSQEAALPSGPFLLRLAEHITQQSGLITADFKVPGILVKSESPLVIQARVHYDLVSARTDFYRQEFVGEWDLEWEQTSTGKLGVRTWRAVNESRSRAGGPAFVDITAQALAGNPSYSQQMLRGTDHWRTVLDAASGIDVYGNNGIAVGDIDHDGFDDLYVCQPAGLPNRLYRNRGDGTFTDVTEAAGVGVLDNTACALFADVDNDGLQDLIVVRAGGPLLFHNLGDGKFQLRAEAFRFAQPPQGAFTGAALADYDRDGWLDIYFCLYSYYEGLDQYRFPTPYCDAQNGPPNFLLRNNRDGTFGDVTAAAGLHQNNNRYSFGCTWCDYNRDVWPDLFVVNDFGRKNLYRNNGNGTFSDVAEDAGVLDIGPGMSSCWLDNNHDGRQDLYVCNMWEPAGNRVSAHEAFMKDAPEGVRALYRRHAKGNSFFHNRGEGRFDDRSAAAGVEKAGWSWSCSAWDFDHDGYPDLYVANGMISGPDRYDLESFFWRQTVSESPMEAVPSRAYEEGWNAINDLIRSDSTWNGYQRNVFFVNNRDGTFTHAAGALGLDFPDDSRAFALADFDLDGRLEVFLKNRTGPQLRILRNVVKDAGRSIAFRLRGHESNRDAIGAEITVKTEQGRQTGFVQAGSGFVSQHTKDVFFGLGQAGAMVRAEIRWPSGRVQRFGKLPVSHRIDIEEGVDEFHATPFRSAPQVTDLPAPQAAPSLPAICETWLLEPLPAPAFVLPDMAGRPHALADFRGRRVLLNFWATWSPSCEGELKSFQKHQPRWAAEGLQLVAVNVNDPGDSSKVRAYARDKGLSFPVLFANDDIAGTYNIVYRYLFDRRRDLGIPTSFLLDEEGSIVKVYQGPVDPNHLQDDLGQIPRTPGDRARRALPFLGSFYGGGFHRNFFSYGVAFSQRGYLDQAVASFQRVVRDYPNYAEAHYNLGTLYLRKRLLAEARDHLLRAVRLRPDYINALNNLGLVAAEQGQTHEAEGYFREALQRNPEYSLALQNLGTLFRQQGRSAEAQEALERALRSAPDDPEANYSLAMVFAQKGDLETAQRYLRSALALRPDYPEALNNLGVLYLRTGNLGEAATTFENCIRLAPNFDQSYLNLAKVYATSGERVKGLGVLQKLLELHPDHQAARKLLELLKP